VQQGLALPRPAQKVAFDAILANLRNVPGHRLPASDLARVIRAAPALEIAAVPLKPSAWILRIDPALFVPVGKGFGCFDREKVELVIRGRGAELGAVKPLPGKLFTTVGHVFPAEYAHLQHLRRR